MKDESNYILKTIALDILMAIVLVFLYSPGLLNLRPSDESIFRAGLSIVTIPIFVALFYSVNVGLIKQKSVETFDGQKVRVKTTDGNILDSIDACNNKIKDRVLYEKSYTCRSCVADIFVQANSDTNDFTVPVVRQKLQYYLDVYVETLKRAITLEKYSNTSL